MSKQPKPATTAGADAHREEQTVTDDEDDEPAPPFPDAPGDRDGGGGGGGDSPLPGAGSAFERVPVKKIAIGAGALLALYILWKIAQENNLLEVERDQPSRDDDPSPEVREARENGLRVNDDGTPAIPQNDDDPLQADHEAGKWLFKNWGN